MLININGQNALEAIDPALFQWCGFLSCLSYEFCIPRVTLYLRFLVRCVSAQGLTMSLHMQHEGQISECDWLHEPE